MITTSTKDIEDGPPKPEAIQIYVNPHFYQIPGVAMLLGTTIGAFRGARSASLRFLAENAHRPPKTLRGWYFYRKTKNYRMILGGLQEAGKDSGKLGLTALGWVGAEDALTRAGWEDVSEIGASLFTAGTFAAVYRLPWKSFRHAILLGLMIGGTTRFLRWIKGTLEGRLGEVDIDVDNKDSKQL